MAMKIAALASGRGSNVGSILRCCKEGTLDCEVVLVAGNNPAAAVFDIAREHGVATWAEDHRGYASRVAFDAALLGAIQAAGAEAIALAGYMRILSPEFIKKFGKPVLNVHPSLLPAFGGAAGGDDAAAYGVRLTGCTVHFVDEGLDSGPVIIQAATSIRSLEEADSFMPRIHPMEHRIFPQALQWLAEGRLVRQGRRVLLQGEKDHTGAKQPDGWLISPPLEGF